MAKKRTKRQEAMRRRRIFLCLCTIVLVLSIAVLTVSVMGISKFFNNHNSGPSGSSSNINSTSSDEPDVKVDDTVYTATVINTGDIILHSTVLTGAKTSNGYDFSAFFPHVKSYFKNADLAVANLEVTLAGDKYEYSGYPRFNAPDSLIDTCKEAGLGFLLTANNHCYDTGLYGFKRTVQVLKEKGMPFIGTKETTEDPTYVVRDVNGIKIGMTCYTYETDSGSKDTKALNGIKLASEAVDLVNSFDYTHIDDFYNEAKSVIDSMKKDGADAVVFYLHWGNEYQFKANTWQKSIAQKLADLGVDIIIGGHPHVIQPMEMIQGAGRDTGTVCLYSMGNAISNQRKELMKPECVTGHTEDGLMFSYTLEKQYGKTVIKSVDIVPTWVEKYKGGSGYLYTMYPIENKSAVSSLGVSDSVAKQIRASYDRTMGIIGEGLNSCQTALGCKVRQIDE